MGAVAQQAACPLSYKDLPLFLFFTCTSVGGVLYVCSHVTLALASEGHGFSVSYYTSLSPWAFLPFWPSRQRFQGYIHLLSCFVTTFHLVSVMMEDGVERNFLLYFYVQGMTFVDFKKRQQVTGFVVIPCLLVKVLGPSCMRSVC